ncbi:UDP-N-acetylmuramoyl-tripeptide--D-alanyl-D-alanine ligase [Microbulbifer thermotolerans]|uniref:UDP-N-acetylmuramoyl-tripeptide--D-alanyl-D- alanine ligase n=1 Tax=Microbulbifer thermotolerans TaxID=252514 RepID=UPI00224B8856|nr:UDP-N-acetylmuramoyl-tripeptide--D-alanyl-D-alanine ligase [Microbulbifer thermotolerans]MCX2781380.1 UDP-N-acetylmuramoyl-tripeptide--D-alanyl-D-alanine ligase [Microbulbifer thermotolerans]MCX2841560.1 UDP-N-acetylmuramoyl-tripeptide--D-alanyl-D-alanine ligase [Microbulbifer thermotolerans]
MISAISLQQLQTRFGGELINGSVQFEQVCTDTRQLDSNALFVALKGERFDAHDFVGELEGQVLGLVVDREIPGSKLPQWRVADTTEALGQIGRMCREQFKGRVIAVTGSCGKTTVKEMLAAIFSQRHNPCVTRGNLNNQFGLPMTLFELTSDHDVLILEMGASGPDEIAYLCGIAKPQVSAVNNVMPAHVEGFGSVDAIARAKGKIYTGLETGGTAVVNADDDYANYWLERMPEGVHTLEVGLGHQWPIHADNIALDDNGCPTFDLCIEGLAHRVRLQLLGEHNVHNALVAAGCAFAAGVPAAEIASGLQSLGGVAGRMQELCGIKGAAIIDDTYNANPGSVAAAIELLAQRRGKRVLVLGDMAELGADAEEMHRQMGELARERGLDALFTLGPLGAAASVAFSAGRHLPLRSYRDRQPLIAALTHELNKNTTVLVKGSRSARMELVVQALCGNAKEDK